jgi:hypothetical protein
MPRPQNKGWHKCSATINYNIMCCMLSTHVCKVSKLPSSVPIKTDSGDQVRELSVY